MANVVEIVINGKSNVSPAVRDAKSSLSSLTGAVEQLTGTSIASVATIAALGTALRFSIGQALEAETAMAQTENVIRSTGQAAGLTSEAIADMASRLQSQTGVADDVIQSGENLLLTFKEIKGQRFEEATTAMLDLAVAMNQGRLEGLNLRGEAIQLGKALNVAAGDTEGVTRAMSALRRTGVSFTQAQVDAAKAAIEAGDAAKYQSIVLGELKTEFGGAAEAAGNTGAGKIEKFKRSLDDLGQTVGEMVLPPLLEFIGTMKNGLEVLNLILQWNDRVNSTYQEQSDEVAKTSDSYAEYAANLAILEEGVKEHIQWMTANNLKYDESGNTIESLVTSVGGLTENEWAAARSQEQMAKTSIGVAKGLGAVGAEALYAAPYVKDVKKAIEDSIDPEEQAKIKLSEYKQALSDLNTIIGGTLGSSMSDFETSQKDLVTQQQELSAELAGYLALNGQAYGPSEDLARIQNEQSLAAANYSLALQAVSDAEGAATTNSIYHYASQDIFNQKVAEAKVKLDEAKSALDSSNQAVANASGGYLNYNQKIEETKGKIDEITAKIKEEADAHDEATRRIIFGMLQQRVQSILTSDTISDNVKDKVLEALNKTAVSMGLIDEATATAMSNVNSAVSGLVNGGNVDLFVDQMENITGPLLSSATTAQGQMSEVFQKTGHAIGADLIPPTKTLEQHLETKLPETVKISWESINGFGDLLALQNAPGGEIPTYVIGLSGITAEALRAGAAIGKIPSLPGTGTTTGPKPGEPGFRGDFAFGGSFQVGGNGGTDSQLVSFRASPSETVTISDGGSPSTKIININIPAPAGSTEADIELLTNRVVEEIKRQQ